MALSFAGMQMRSIAVNFKSTCGRATTAIVAVRRAPKMFIVKVRALGRSSSLNRDAGVIVHCFFAICREEDPEAYSGAPPTG